jgi:hypothetical protein
VTPSGGPPPATKNASAALLPPNGVIVFGRTAASEVRRLICAGEDQSATRVPPAQTLEASPQLAVHALQAEIPIDDANAHRSGPPNPLPEVKVPVVALAAERVSSHPRGRSSWSWFAIWVVCVNDHDEPKTFRPSVRFRLGTIRCIAHQPQNNTTFQTTATNLSFHLE